MSAPQAELQDGAGRGLTEDWTYVYTADDERAHRLKPTQESDIPPAFVDRSTRVVRDRTREFEDPIRELRDLTRGLHLRTRVVRLPTRDLHHPTRNLVHRARDAERRTRDVGHRTRVVDAPSYTHLEGLPSFECEDEIADALEPDPDRLGTRGAVSFAGQITAETSHQDEDLS